MRVVWEFARPRRVVTTPNADYNAVWEKAMSYVTASLLTGRSG